VGFFRIRLKEYKKILILLLAVSLINILPYAFGVVMRFLLLTIGQIGMGWAAKVDKSQRRYFSTGGWEKFPQRKMVEKGQERNF